MEWVYTKEGIDIYIESEIEEVYIENVLGLREEGDAITLIYTKDGYDNITLRTARKGLTHEALYNPEDNTLTLPLELEDKEIVELQKLATEQNMTVDDFISEVISKTLEAKKE